MPAIGESSHPAQRGPTVTANPDRWIRLLYGLRQKVERIKAVEFTVETGGFLRPEYLKDLKVFVRQCAATVKLKAPQRLEFFAQPTNTHADGYPTFRQHIDSRQHFRSDYRIAVRENHDTGNQPEVLCFTGNKGHQRQLLQCLPTSGKVSTYRIRVA